MYERYPFGAHFGVLSSVLACTSWRFGCFLAELLFPLLYQCFRKDVHEQAVHILVHSIRNCLYGRSECAFEGLAGR